MNIGILAGCPPALFPLVQHIGRIEGLKSYLSSLASDSITLRKKLSRDKSQPVNSEPRESESLKCMKTSNEGRPSDEEMMPSAVGKEPWFVKEQTKIDTSRAINEGY